MTDPHPSLQRRKIIHVDMDAFYASIEALDDPRLRGRPLIVGGRPDSRGVVATASYEARKYGVRSAMASAKAARLCPDGIFVAPRFERYREVSEQVREICLRYSDRIEPLSLDEAYLDVTDNVHGLFAVEIARRIRADILRECGLTASAGVAPNKLVAKIASDQRKPDGLTVVTPAEVAGFMAPLPLARLHGIGPVTAQRLAGHGLVLCQDVLDRGRDEMTTRFGTSFGGWLWERSQGLDDREVETSRQRKSFGQETTFARDLATPEQMAGALRRLGTELADTLRAAGRKGRTITLKVRYPDFTSLTRATTLSFPTQSPDLIIETAVRLLQKTDAHKKRVRLLGIAVSKLDEWEATTRPTTAAEGVYVQPSLFGD